MAWSRLTLLLWLSALASVGFAQTVVELVGTWSTKSNKTLTGPGFYNPTKDEFNEPDLTGISYSFTADGHYESAYYRALAKPTNPKCPRGIMQWQHGEYELRSDGSLKLDPIAIDGRQLMSDPCNYDTSILTRYNITEKFERFEVFIDPYHEILRLNLFKFDGAPLPPMYLALKPPRMLPTTTLHAGTSTATAGAKETISKSKRDLLLDQFMPAVQLPELRYESSLLKADQWWWFGVVMTGLGSLLYFGY